MLSQYMTRAIDNAGECIFEKPRNNFPHNFRAYIRAFDRNVSVIRLAGEQIDKNYYFFD